jgi:hypothetical protein
LRRLCESENSSDFVGDDFGVLEDIVVSGDSVGADVLDVKEAIYAAIDGRTAFQSTSIKAVLDTVDTVADSLTAVSHGAGVANRGEDGPAAVSLFDLCESTSLDSVPVVDAAGILACPGRATTANGHLIDDVH